MEKSLKDESVIVFATVEKQKDGMPTFSVLDKDLDKILKHEKLPEELVLRHIEHVKERKVVRHPPVDMGVPPPVKGAETSARAGAIFDPKFFKGNRMLFQHLNEVSHSMLRKPI